MKIYEVTLIQRVTFQIDFYTEPKPKERVYMATKFENTIEYEKWLKTKQTADIHPSMVQAFTELACKWRNRAFFTSDEWKEGIFIPSENIEIKADYSKCTYTTEHGWYPKPISYGFLKTNDEHETQLIKSTTNCPTCGSEVLVVGKTTHHYVPIHRSLDEIKKELVFPEAGNEQEGFIIKGSAGTETFDSGEDIVFKANLPKNGINKEEIETLKDQLFKLANKFAGDEYGHIAVMLHGVHNKI